MDLNNNNKMLIQKAVPKWRVKTYATVLNLEFSFTVVPIEVFRKMLISSFPNFEKFLWTIPQQFDKFLKKFLTSCFIDQSDCSKIKFDWSMKQEVRNFLTNIKLLRNCSEELLEVRTVHFLTSRSSSEQFLNNCQHFSERFYWHDCKSSADSKWSSVNRFQSQSES
jgi:hypothetical protein